MQRFNPVPRRQLPFPLPQSPFQSLHAATVVVLSATMAIAAFAVAWSLGEANISAFFRAWNALELNPPQWILTPVWVKGAAVFLPTAFTIAFSQVVVRLSPRPRGWSRLAVVALLVVVTVRYLLWRSLTTLNLADPLDGMFSLALFGMELAVLSSNILRLCSLVGVKSRRAEADRHESTVLAGDYRPSVDILIPTYNEPVSVLRRTVVGCQAIAYGPKSVYLLDDGDRVEVKQLARQLGCHYIARPGNRHAKAGNINYALTRTSGELVVVFDADFVPTTNFLTRTVGFFQDRTVGLLQTHQSFYNADPVARNLQLEDVLPHEVEIFSRHYQPLRDTNETALCYGSSFVVRRRSLERVNGFVTESLSEDYFTGIRISANGDRVIYLDESLSAGLCAENMSGHVLQRQRWARGTLQAFFIQANPLTIPGLSWLQRLAHFEGISQWVFSFFRIVFLLMPIAYVGLGVIPVRAAMQDWVFFFLPFYILQLLTFSWLNERSRSAIVSDIYEVAQCVPVTLAMLQTLFRPFSAKFQVTPKGVSSDRHVFNWDLAWPTIVLWLLTAGALLFSVSYATEGFYPFALPQDERLLGGISLAWLWSGYNLFVLSISLMLMRDVPKPSVYDWLDYPLPVKLWVEGWEIACRARQISEIGIRLDVSNGAVADRLAARGDVRVELLEKGLMLSGRVMRKSPRLDDNCLEISFGTLSVTQHRALIEAMFCQPNRWLPMQTPNELRSLWVLTQLFVSPVKQAIGQIITEISSQLQKERA